MKEEGNNSEKRVAQHEEGKYYSEAKSYTTSTDRVLLYRVHIRDREIGLQPKYGNHNVVHTIESQFFEVSVLCRLSRVLLILLPVFCHQNTLSAPFSSLSKDIIIAGVCSSRSLFEETTESYI